MVSGSRLGTALLLAISITASPLNAPSPDDKGSLEKRVQNIVVGFRTVAAPQAQSYFNAGGFLTFDGSRSSDQLGPGAYISPVLGDWPGSPNNYDCAILADANAWNLVNKAWVPEIDIDGCTPLWWTNGAPNRDKYLRDVGSPSFASSNTILFSQIQGFEKLQLLIPPQLIAKSAGLNLVVQCALKSDTDGIAALQGYGRIDWYQYANAKGIPQHVNPP